MKHLDEFEDYIDLDGYILDEGLSVAFKKSVKAIKKQLTKRISVLKDAEKNALRNKELQKAAKAKADIKILKRKARSRVEILKKNELAKQKQAKLAQQTAKKDKGAKVISINRKQAA